MNEKTVAIKMLKRHPESWKTMSANPLVSPDVRKLCKRLLKKKC
jgi:hypothetical protein